MPRAPLFTAAADRVEHARFYSADLPCCLRGTVFSFQPICPYKHPAGGRVQPAAGGHQHRDKPERCGCSFELGLHQRHRAPLSFTGRGQRPPDHCSLQGGAGKVLFQPAVPQGHPVLYEQRKRPAPAVRPAEQLFGPEPEQRIPVFAAGIWDAVHHRPADDLSPGLPCHQQAHPLRPWNDAPRHGLSCVGSIGHHRSRSGLYHERGQRTLLGNGQSALADRGWPPDTGGNCLF